VKVVDAYQLYSKVAPPTIFPSQPKLVQCLTKEVAVPNRLPGFKEQELANIIYALGLLRALTPLLWPP